LDAAAKEFSEAYDTGMIPMEFVNSMRKKGQLIMGIGHRVKSVIICLMFVYFDHRACLLGNSQMRLAQYFYRYKVNYKVQK